MKWGRRATSCHVVAEPMGCARASDLRANHDSYYKPKISTAQAIPAGPRHSLGATALFLSNASNYRAAASDAATSIAVRRAMSWLPKSLAP